MLTQFSRRSQRNYYIAHSYHSVDIQSVPSLLCSKDVNQSINQSLFQAYAHRTSNKKRKVNVKTYVFMFFNFLFHKSAFRCIETSDGAC